MVFGKIPCGMLVPGLNGTELRCQPLRLYGTQALHDVLVEELIRVVPASVVVEEAATTEPNPVSVDVNSKVAFGDWVGYNATQGNTTWLAGGDFGMFSTESYPSLDFGKDAALMFGSGFHFLNGKTTTRPVGFCTRPSSTRSM